MDSVQRLRKTQDFARVRTDGKSWADGFLVVAAIRNGTPTTRFGFTVGRRVGNAVTRNRVKRRLREATSEVCTADGWDVVVIARNRAADADYHALKRSVTSLLARGGIQSERAGGAG